MKIFVVRHGETIWNKLGIIQGAKSNRLSRDGKEQVQTTALQLADKSIDLIISSPLFRTIQTANILNRVLNTTIVKDERLTEIGQGIYAGKAFSDLTPNERKRKALRLKEDGIESYGDAYLRTYDFVSDLKTKYSDKRVLIVTHNAVASLIECIVTYGKYNKTDFANLKLFGNAQLKEFEL